MKVIASVDDALASVGDDLSAGEWKLIDQQRIDAFADITDDHQWIHTDVDRARNESPYGSTIAHGFLTLSLIPALKRGNYSVRTRKWASITAWARCGSSTRLLRDRESGSAQQYLTRPRWPTIPSI